MLIADWTAEAQHQDMVESLLVALGLLGLTIGSGLVVRGALAIAQRTGVSPLVVGLTITSIGTSIPEIATNIAVGADVLAGVPASQIAVGNIVGSCMSQITLMLGLAGFAGLLVCPRRLLRRDGTIMVLAMLAMFSTSLDGTIGRLEGGLLATCYLAYLVGVFFHERQWSDDSEEEQVELPAMTTGRALSSLVVGLFIVVVSADVAVENAVSLARAAGVGSSLIGLGIGIGTGLPELSVSVRALREKSGPLGLGNLMGSNITDPLLSTGLGALVAPVEVPPITVAFDFPFWMAATAVALLLLSSNLNLNRRESGVLLIVFGLFVWVRLTLLPL